MSKKLAPEGIFWVKVINVDFQQEKYMQIKENDVSNFFLQYLRHSDVTK